MNRGRQNLGDNEVAEKEHIKNTLNDLKDKFGYKQKDIVGGTGLPQNTVSRYFSGVSRPKKEALQKLADFFGVDIKVFRLKEPKSTIQEIYDELEDFRQNNVLDYANEQLREQQAESEIISIYNQDNLTSYQVYEKLSAGEGESYFEDRNYDIVYFNKDIQHDFASWVYGDSMEPKFKSGSVALIKDTGFDYDGAIYAVDWDGQSYIKRVYKDKDGLRLVSLNDKYKDKKARWEENPRIIGKVVGNFMPLER